MIQPGNGYTSTNVAGAVTLNIEPTWQFWNGPRPFEISAYKSGTDYMVQVWPGSVNNIEPTMGGTPLTNNPRPSMNIGYSSYTSWEYIYVQLPVGGSGSPPPFPDAPIIMHDSTPQTNTDSVAYLLLGIVDKNSGNVTQYVSGSQWAERYKCGSDDAAYFFGLV